MDIGTWLTICLRGRLIGSDVLGNRYYLEKSQRLVTLHHRHAIAGIRQASLAEATCSERNGHSVGLSPAGP